MHQLEWRYAVMAHFQKFGVKASVETFVEPEIYDLIGVKPSDGRKTDWMNPHSFYNTHLSTVDLYFEELDNG